MKPIDPRIQALKNPYARRASGLAGEEHPAGVVALDDAELEAVNGGGTPIFLITASIRFCRFIPIPGRAAGVAAGAASLPKYRSSNPLQVRLWPYW